MTLQLRYLGAAEAAAADGRGVFHLLGFDPSVLAFPTFPVTWQLALVGLFESDTVDDHALQPGTPLTLSLTLRDPDRTPLMIQQQTVPLGVRQYPDIPHRVQFVAQVGVTFARAGDYTLEMVLTTPDAAPVEAARTLYVRTPL